MALLPTDRMDSLFSPRRVWMDGPIIVGAGPSGLAVAASLCKQGVPFAVKERTDCIASLWQMRTYDRLKLHFPKLHLPKQFCELPRMPFPEHYPEYPTRRQFIDYFDIKPEFNHTVLSASCDETSGLWRVRAAAAGSEMEYIGRWLVLATGENAESVVPDTPGLAGFGGEVTHVSQYNSSKSYRGKFDIKTEFNHAVLSVRFVETSGLWWHPPPRPRPPPSAPRSRTQRRLPPPRVPNAVASPITQPRGRRPSRR